MQSHCQLQYQDKFSVAYSYLINWVLGLGFCQDAGFQVDRNFLPVLYNRDMTSASKSIDGNRIKMGKNAQNAQTRRNYG